MRQEAFFPNRANCVSLPFGISLPSTLQKLEGSQVTHTAPRFHTCLFLCDHYPGQGSRLHHLGMFPSCSTPQGSANLSFTTDSFPFTHKYNQRTEKAMAPHSSTLAWKIPWTEEPGRLQSLGSRLHFHALEKEMATHSSILSWRIPGTGEPGGLSMRSHRVGHD